MDACPAAGTRPGLTVRLLPYRVEDGPTNMALDEALLVTAAIDGLASLRFYGWSEPTLSLGYFQHSAPALVRFPLPWLRRSTGGAALVHHHELTYALALPPGKDWQPRGVSWICQFHHAVRRALVGTDATICVAEMKLGDILCFLHHTPGDLLIGNDKVGGSAQRKSHGALLQHGGILLRCSHHTPNLPGIEDLTSRSIAPEAIVASFAADTGWVLETGELTAREFALADEARRERYQSTVWNSRR